MFYKKLKSTRFAGVVLASGLLAFNIFSAHAQSQLDMTTHAGEAYKKADLELNQTYQAVMQKFKNDKRTKSKIKAAEIAWLKYRDAEMEAIYPGTDKQYDYGSVYPMCHSMELTAITEHRTQELKLWLEPDEDGVCNGSRH